MYWEVQLQESLLKSRAFFLMPHICLQFVCINLAECFNEWKQVNSNQIPIYFLYFLVFWVWKRKMFNLKHWDAFSNLTVFLYEEVLYIKEYYFFSEVSQISVFLSYLIKDTSNVSCWIFLCTMAAPKILMPSKILIKKWGDVFCA